MRTKHLLVGLASILTVAAVALLSNESMAATTNTNTTLKIKT